MTTGMENERFALLCAVDDPLSAEKFEAYLDSQGIAVNVREQQGGTVSRITDGVLPFWELFVPEAELGRAAKLVEEIRAKVEAEADEAGRAAEDESGA
jgi:hypothetical protein